MPWANPLMERSLVTLLGLRIRMQMSKHWSLVNCSVDCVGSQSPRPLLIGHRSWWVKSRHHLMYCIRCVFAALKSGIIASNFGFRTARVRSESVSLDPNWDHQSGSTLKSRNWPGSGPLLARETWSTCAFVSLALPAFCDGWTAGVTRSILHFLELDAHVAWSRYPDCAFV